MRQEHLDGYLALLGVARPEGAPDAALLAELQRRHLIAVPFENLDIHLGRPIRLVEDELVAKVVDRRRGGFCYELNGAFGALLRALGYDVSLLAARVFVDGGASVGIPYDHMTLLVRLDEPWLADVGFGRFAREPLRFDVRDEQPDAEGVFRIVDGPDGDVDVHGDGGPEFRMEIRPRELVDFTAGAWWHQTSPLSHFTRGPVCTRLTPEGGRITLAGRTFIRTGPDGRHQEELPDDAAILAAYREHFGIVLDRVPDNTPPVAT
ncbi:arylamine N-acetyltransferase family protein [Streptodolium elevatio]|uniref:Arylamine N-acetyltransferase n=1 Tax=Streptodolium elevatio TaxID=3157996 RepID=A0ABV3DJ71_9ACTN